jgi:malonyl-CoA O-methyltransferase
MDKSIITGNFSKSAISYDDHAAVQRKCAKKLIDLIREEKFSRILEIGCGTGIYTRFLRKTYKDAHITAIDISEDMVNVARKKLEDENISYMVADGENIPQEGKFDLITSNASFQWFEDLAGAIEVFSKALADGGTLCFSMYGPETFREFKEVLSAHFGRRQWLSSSRFTSFQEMESLIEQYFCRSDMTEERLTSEFFSLWDFLRDIKHSGTRGEGLGSSTLLGKYAIREMERTYVEKFGSIVATHHVYFCKARI